MCVCAEGCTRHCAWRYQRRPSLRTTDLFVLFDGTRPLYLSHGAPRSNRMYSSPQAARQVGFAVDRSQRGFKVCWCEVSIESYEVRGAAPRGGGNSYQAQLFV